jgi:hypothetical protein
MKKVVIILSLLLLLTSFKPAEKTSKSIELIHHNHLYFIRVILNGKKANLLIDTGAAASLLDINQAKDYNFKFNKTNENFAGVGGLSSRYRVFNYKFNHDSTTLPVYPFGADLKFIAETFEEKGMPIVGVIGSDFLKKNDAVIDYKRKKLILN